MDAQGLLAERLGAVVAGWKVGVAADGTPIAAPLFAADVREGDAAFDLPGEHGLLVEVELAVRLALDRPAGRSYARSDILDSVSEVLVGIEILGSRFAQTVPPLAALADNLGNRGYVVGPGRADFRGLDLTALVARLTRDGVRIEEKTGGHPQGDPLAPLLAYANAQTDRLGGLRAGQIVTTGTLTTPFMVEGPCRVEGGVSEIGAVRLAFTRA